MNSAVKETLSGLDADCCLPDGAHYDTRQEAIKAATDYIAVTEPVPLATTKPAIV